jgi:hypothetical protein
MLGSVAVKLIRSQRRAGHLIVWERITSSKELVLQSHVRLGLKTNTGTENVGQSSTLLGQSIDDRSARWSQGRLEHEAEDAENAVEVAKILLLGLASLVGAPLDTGHHLGDEDQVDNEWRGKQRVFADIEDADGLMAAHEDLGVILVESTLVIANRWHVLDDDAVVWMLALLVQLGIGSDHIIDNIGLGDLLGAELPVRAQIHAVVVAEMVVAGNAGELDTGVDEEVDEGRLHLGLARLEVIAANVSLVLLSKLDGSRNKGVLGGTIDEWSTLENGGNSEDGRRRDFFMSFFDGLEQILGSVIDTLDEVGVTLGIGSPLNDDLVQVIRSLEVAVLPIRTELLDQLVSSIPDVFANLFYVFPGCLGSRNQVISTLFLVGSNEVWVVNGWERSHSSHFLLDKLLQGRLQDGGSVQGISQVESANVPSADNEIIGVHHWKHLVEWNINLQAGLGIRAELDRGSHEQGTIIVGFLLALFGLPAQSTAVGQDPSSDCGAIVSTPADQHDADLRDLAIDLEVVHRLLWGCKKLTIGTLSNRRSPVGVLAHNLAVSVLDIGRVDREKVTVSSCRCRAIGQGKALAIIGVRSHCRCFSSVA